MRKWDGFRVHGDRPAGVEAPAVHHPLAAPGGGRHRVVLKQLEGDRLHGRVCKSSSQFSLCFCSTSLLIINNAMFQFLS